MTNDIVGRIVAGLKEPDERKKYGDQGGIGPSDLSGCSRRVKYTIERSEQRESKYWLPAQIGTAFHSMLKTVADNLGDSSIVTEQELRIRLGEYEITGTADLIDKGNSVVYDHKTVADMDWVKKHGPDPKHIKQVHLYAMGAAQAGLIDRDALMMGALVYWDRGGTDQDPYVVHFDIDEGICDALVEKYRAIMTTPLDEVPREEALPTCLNLCPYAHTCRADFFESPDVSDDPGVLALLDEYQKVKDDIKGLQKHKKAIEEEVSVIPDGRVGNYSVKWIRIGESIVPEYSRKGYEYVRITKAGAR